MTAKQADHAVGYGLNAAAKNVNAAENRPERRRDRPMKTGERRDGK